MDIILWRHAEAHALREGQDDLTRTLTAKGERQAQRMADWLNQRMAHSTRIFVSPAVRAQQTAKALGKNFKTAPTLAPDASPEALLSTVRWPDASEPVLVVGHQPTLGVVASLLLSEAAQTWTLKKGGVWWLRHRDREGEGKVVLLAVQTPEYL
jgi:phosphohistidine phosphatase